MTFSFYEFFADGGMARLGLSADWVCTFANDINDAKANSYRANFGASHLRVCDVARLVPNDLPGRADLAWMSFACQDRKGAGLQGYRSNAVWPCLRLVRALRAEGRAPRTIVLENVTGLLTEKSAGFFDAIGAQLEAEYRFGVAMIDAALFLPQSRERIFIVAVDRAVTIPAELVDDKPSLPFHPQPLVAALHRKAQPIWWNLSVPPARNTVLADLIEDTPTGVPWHTRAETDRLVSMMSAANLAKLEAAKRADKRMIGVYFKRMRDEVQRVEIRFDDISGCLRVPTGGSSRQDIMVVDGDRVRSRLLSPREAARLGLPDSYALPSNVNEGLFLKGDGVCADVVRHLAQHILEPILRAHAEAPVIEIQRTKADPLGAT